MYVNWKRVKGKKSNSSTPQAMSQILNKYRESAQGFCFDLSFYLHSNRIVTELVKDSHQLRVAANRECQLCKHELAVICAPAFPASHSLITIPLHDIQRNASTACQLFILNLISPYFRPRKVQLKCSVLLAAFNELCGRVIFVVAIKLGAIYMCYHFQ